MRNNSYNTISKQLILDFLKSKSEETLSANDIFEHMNTIQKPVNITTIYRYLDKLVQNNIVHKYTDDDGKKSTYRYVGENSYCHEHLHLQCSKCGKIIHLDCEFMEEVIKHIDEKHHFSLKCDKSILYGKCEECSQKEKDLSLH